MIKRLTNVMQKTCTLGCSDINANLTGKQTGKMSNLNRMLESILTIACSKLHLTKKSYKFRMNTMYTNFKCSSFTLFSHHGLNFLLSLLYHLFNSCRMDTAINNKLLKGYSCDLTAYRVKSGQNNCLRCIINNQINTCHRLKSSDISSLSTDNSALHLVIRKLNN